MAAAVVVVVATASASAVIVRDDVEQVQPPDDVQSEESDHEAEDIEPAPAPPSVDPIVCVLRDNDVDLNIETHTRGCGGGTQRTLRIKRTNGHAELSGSAEVYPRGVRSVRLKKFDRFTAGRWLTTLVSTARLPETDVPGGCHSTTGYFATVRWNCSEHGAGEVRFESHRCGNDNGSRRSGTNGRLFDDDSPAHRLFAAVDAILDAYVEGRR